MVNVCLVVYALFCVCNCIVFVCVYVLCFVWFLCVGLGLRVGHGFSKSNIGYENYGFSYLRKYVERVKGLLSLFVFQFRRESWVRVK